MRLGFFSTMATLLAGTGMALGQGSTGFAPEQQLQQAPTRLGRSGVQRTSATQVQQAQAVQPVPVAPERPLPYDVGEPPAVVENGTLMGYGGLDQPYRFWATSEFLLWRLGSIPLPEFQSLTNAGTITVQGKNVIQDITGGGLPQDFLFNLNLPVEVVVDTGLPGSQNQDLRDQPGVKFSAGWWLDPEQTWGVDASFFWLWNRSIRFTQQASFSETIRLDETQSITFVDPAGTLQTPDPIVSPLFVAANVNNNVVGAVSNQVWGVEFNGRRRAAYFGPATFDVLAGVRYIEVTQTSSVSQAINLTPAGAGQGADPGLGILFPSTATLAGAVTTSYSDTIGLKNHFYGGQLGAAFEWYVTPRLFLAGCGKAAIGGMRQVGTLTGVTTNTAGATSSGGLLVSPSDSGTEARVDRVAFVPEANLSVGLELIPGLRVFAGYNVIHFSTLAKIGNVTTSSTTTGTVRFGDQGSGGATVVQPGFRFSGEKTNLQGVNLGAEFRY